VQLQVHSHHLHLHPLHLQVLPLEEELLKQDVLLEILDNPLHRLLVEKKHHLLEMNKLGYQTNYM
jgi:hypothetical protein